MAMASRRLLLLILVGAFGWVARTSAAPALDHSAPAKAETFFNTVLTGDTAKAFDTLLAGTTLSANKPEVSYHLRQQLQTGMSAYGKPLGFDLVEQKAFGTSLIRLVYILRLEKYPLTWEFFFYNGGSGWLPVDVRFNDRLDVYRYGSLPTSSEPAQP